MSLFVSFSFRETCITFYDTEKKRDIVIVALDDFAVSYNEIGEQIIAVERGWA